MAINTNLKSLVPRREVYKKTVKLVSGGYYDRKAFPTGEITVYPWDSQIDAWFTERVRLPNRDRVLWEAAAKVSDLNGCPIENVLVGDAWTILMVSKSIRTGCKVAYVATCPSCGREHNDDIQIPDELQIKGQKALDFTGYEDVTLPDSKDVVKYRFLNIGDEIRIAERSPEEKEKISDIMAHILFPIVSVNGGNVDSKDEVLAWYSAISPVDVDLLDKQQGVAYPELKSELPHECDGCKKKFSYNLDLNNDFFRAGER